MYAILDAKSWQDGPNVQNVVWFYDTAHHTLLYTYALTTPDDPHVTLALREWDTDQQMQYSVLQSVGLNFVNATLSGNCTLPSSSSGPVNGTTKPCMSGTFDTGKQLSLTVNSFLPSNTTNSTTTRLRIDESAWSYSQSDVPPELTLHDVNENDNSLGAVVLRTVLTSPHDCTQLKVCVARGGEAEEEGLGVGAEALAPLAIVFVKQAAYALVCTTPNNNS